MQGKLFRELHAFQVPARIDIFLTHILQAVEDEVARIEKDLATLKKTDVQLTEQRKAATSKIKKLEKSLTEDRHAKSEAENAIRNNGETLEKFGGEKEKLKGDLEKEQAELGKVMDALRGESSRFPTEVTATADPCIVENKQTRLRVSRRKSRRSNKL